MPNAPAAQAVARTAKDRARDARDRRRRGYRCAIVEIASSELAALVEHGFLAPAEQSDRDAIETALAAALDSMDLPALIAAAARRRSAQAA